MYSLNHDKPTSKEPPFGSNATSFSFFLPSTGRY
jgi:hypothetical protein